MRRVAAAGGVLLPLLHRQPAGTGAYVPASQRKAPRGADLRGTAAGAVGIGTVGDPRRPRCPGTTPDRWCPDAGAADPTEPTGLSGNYQSGGCQTWYDGADGRMYHLYVCFSPQSNGGGAPASHRSELLPADASGTSPLCLFVEDAEDPSLDVREDFSALLGLPHGGGRGCRGQRYLHHPGGDGFLLQRGGPAGPRA